MIYTLRMKPVSKENTLRQLTAHSWTRQDVISEKSTVRPSLSAMDTVSPCARLSAFFSLLACLRASFSSGVSTALKSAYVTPHCTKNPFDTQ